MGLLLSYPTSYLCIQCKASDCISSVPSIVPALPSQICWPSCKAQSKRSLRIRTSALLWANQQWASNYSRHKLQTASESWSKSSCWGTNKGMYRRNSDISLWLVRPYPIQLLPLWLQSSFLLKLAELINFMCSSSITFRLGLLAGFSQKYRSSLCGKQAQYFPQWR